MDCGQAAVQRHMLGGAFVVAALVFLRGAWLALPLGALVLVIHDGLDGVVTVLQILLAFAVAILGGALAGAAYTLIGHHVNRAP